MSDRKLLLDLGGTNLRAGLGSTDTFLIDDISKTRVDKNEEIFEVIRSYIKKDNIKEIIFSAAGPRSTNKVSMTNRSLEISGTSIEDEFKVSRCDMLNDWESIGYCLPLLNDEDFIQLKGGQRNPEETSIAIGPGTGLGFSILRYINNTPYVFATELGNTKSFNDYLFKRFELEPSNDFSVLESFLSGTGIQKIYRSISGEDVSSEDVVDSYGDDKKATQLLNNFCRAFGRILADLNLTILAKGGIYFAGGLMRRIHKLEAIEYLFQEFNSHNSKHHKDLLKNTSINLITKEHTPLYGNLNYSIVRRMHE